jgi:D-arabinose 5-phosphate isomerase GutQ
MATDEAIRELLESEGKLYLLPTSVFPGDQDVTAPLPWEVKPTSAEITRLNLRTPDGLARAIRNRAIAIGFAINNTIVNSRDSIARAVDELERWIQAEDIVRVVGAGRALLAASIPANRLAHAGARVFVLHAVVPLPNPIRGGAILAASASGKTPSVLHLMETARQRNPSIRILGMADSSAVDFARLCHVFVGIDQTTNPYINPLQALADTAEYIISELLDAMVVAAAKRLGLTDRDFREGHEDLGNTGPYLPEEADK